MTSSSASAPVSTNTTPNRRRKFIFGGVNNNNNIKLRLHFLRIKRSSNTNLSLLNQTNNNTNVSDNNNNNNNNINCDERNNINFDNTINVSSSAKLYNKSYQKDQRSLLGSYMTKSSMGLNDENTNNSVIQNQTPSNNQIITSTSSSRHCQYYWCCCCHFPCITVTNSNSSSSKPQVSSDLSSRLESIIIEERLTMDQVKKWAESFDYMLQSPAGQRVFREYLKTEYSEENILFYIACEELKNEKCSEVVEEKARYIYEDYISILSPNEVSLDSRVRDIINENMIEPNAGTFDEAQLQIYTLMNRDSYPRFLNSKLYKDILFILQNNP